MSEESVEIARAAFESWNRGDYEAWIEAFDEEAEFIPMRAQLEGRSYHGHDGLHRFIDEMFEEWEQVRFEVDEIREGERYMAAFGRVRARGRASGVDLDVPLALVGTVRNSKIAYARFYADRAGALAAAGLSE
jgi:ketosteroid isomerase-like protein